MGKMQRSRKQGSWPIVPPLIVAGVAIADAIWGITGAMTPSSYGARMVTVRAPVPPSPCEQLGCVVRQLQVGAGRQAAGSATHSAWVVTGPDVILQ